jgi:hypothetical protein
VSAAAHTVRCVGWVRVRVKVRIRVRDRIYSNTDTNRNPDLLRPIVCTILARLSLAASLAAESLLRSVSTTRMTRLANSVAFFSSETTGACNLSVRVRVRVWVRVRVRVKIMVKITVQFQVIKRVSGEILLIFFGVNLTV